MDTINSIITAIGVFLFGLTIALVVACIAVFPAMWLWNYIMPDLGLPVLGFWKVFGLIVLLRILIPTSNTTVNKKN